MSMSDGITKLHKIMFSVGGRQFRFAINPDNYVHRKPHRAVAIKTKSRVVVEDFQSDLSTIVIKGTTGFNPTGRTEDRGYNKIKELKKYIEDYAKMGGNGSTPSKDFYFYNFTNKEYFIVHLAPEGVTFLQDVQSPLTYKYEINLVVLRYAGEPAEGDIIEPEIGNRFPSIGKPQERPDLIGPPLPDGSWSPGSGWKDEGNSGNTGNEWDDVYTGDDRDYVPGPNSDPINPQAPSNMSYHRGNTSLGYSIGYYGRYT